MQHKVTYGFNVRLNGQTEYEFQMQRIICESLIDTGMKTVKVIDALRTVVPKNYHIIVDRKGPRVHDIRFALGRLTVQEAYQVLPFDKWIHYSTDMTIADIKFVKQKLEENGKKLSELFENKIRDC